MRACLAGDMVGPLQAVVRMIRKNTGKAKTRARRGEEFIVFQTFKRSNLLTFQGPAKRAYIDGAISLRLSHSTYGINGWSFLDGV